MRIPEFSLFPRNSSPFRQFDSSFGLSDVSLREGFGDNVHRSVLSATLSPFDGRDVGQHPLVSLIVRGVFQWRPPERRFFQRGLRVWRFCFSASPPQLSYAATQSRLLAMASSRRPSELALLRCSSAFMIINANHVRFLPSRLSKMDRPGHLGRLILIRRLPAFSGDDVSLCPVASLKEFLESRRSLGISHHSLFSSPTPPFSPFSTVAFLDLLRWSFCHAGIAAPPGSTSCLSFRCLCSWRWRPRLFGGGRLV